MKFLSMLRALLRTRMMKAVMALALVVPATLAATPTAAAAAFNAHGCPNNYACFWTNVNFSGNRVFFGYPSGCNDTTPYQNQISSVVNNTSRDFWLRMSLGCKSGYTQVHARSAVSNLSDIGFNNTVRSFGWQTG